MATEPPVEYALEQGALGWRRIYRGRTVAVSSPCIRSNMMHEVLLIEGCSSELLHKTARQHVPWSDGEYTSVESTQDRCVLTFPLVLISAPRAMQLVLFRMDMREIRRVGTRLRCRYEPTAS